MTVACFSVDVVGSGSDAVNRLECDLTSVPVNAGSVTVTVNGGCYTGAGEDVLAVFDPGLGFATGGGWFYWPDTADPETGYQGDKTSFGFTMSYSKKGQKVKGNFLMIRHLADGPIYRAKSNALYALAPGQAVDPATGGTPGWATFSGKSTYLEPGWDDAVGNHEFTAYVEDRTDAPTTVDRVWVEIRDKDGIRIEAVSLLSPAAGNAIDLGGGNISVPHGDSQKKR